MKLIILMILFGFILQPNEELVFVKENQEVQKDTIEFTPSWNFTGRCEHLCNVYVGGRNTITKINGVALKENEYVSIFVKCPTKIRLRAGKLYKFTAEKFIINSCTTIIDTVKNSRNFRLIESIN